MFSSEDCLKDSSQGSVDSFVIIIFEATVCYTLKYAYFSWNNVTELTVTVLRA